MTAASLRVPHNPPVTSPPEWFRLLGMPVGWSGQDNIRNAVYYNGNTYLGYIDGDGNTKVASYDHATGAVVVSPTIVAAGAPPDTHTTPAVLVRSSDQKIVTAIIPHNSGHVYIAVSTNAEDVSSFGSTSDIASTLAGSGRYAYPSLFQLSGETGKIYLFYRDQDVIGPPSENVLCYSTSTDGGSTWAAETKLFKNTNSYCMWALDSDDAARIDIVISSGSADQDSTADLYHFYYDGSFKKSDGTAVGGSSPHAPADVTKIYDGATNGLVREPYCLVGGTGPIVVWAAYDTAGAGSNEHYWYGIYTGGAWSVHEIIDTGTPPFSNFLEGGLAIDRLATSDVFLSRYVSSQWRMYRYTTADAGATWTMDATLSTESDQPNLRPISPHNANSALPIMWLYGPRFPAPPQGDVSMTEARGYPNPVSAF